jgi:hypothetical protein
VAGDRSSGEKYSDLEATLRERERRGENGEEELGNGRGMTQGRLCPGERGGRGDRGRFRVPEREGRLEVRERPDWWGPPVRERREKMGTGSV